MGVNLKGIAKELNLSISTVSRVVTGTGRISPATRAKVMQALKEHQYVPNQIARSLKTHETKTIGIIVPDIADYFSRVIKGADEILSADGYSIILVDTNESAEKERRYTKLLYEKQVDGLLLATVITDRNEWVNDYRRQGIPIVFFDNEPNLDEDYDAVLLDNIKASALAVNHLAENGHSRIAVVSGERSESTARERCDGFRIAMEKQGLSPDPALIREGTYHLQSGRRCMEELLADRDEHPFTAVFATSYKMTCGAILAIKEAGLRYPEDIALVGFDFEDEYRLHVPSITSIIQPVKNIGSVLATRLLDNLQQTKNGEESHHVPQKTMLMPSLKLGMSSARTDQISV